jgi:hypothetical protein
MAATMIRLAEHFEVARRFCTLAIEPTQAKEKH